MADTEDWMGNRQRTGGFAAVALVLGVMMSGLTIAALVTGVTSDPVLALQVFLYGPLAYVALRMGRGWLRAGVAVTPTHVIVRGPWARRSFALIDVEGFLTGEQPGGSGGVLMRLADGRKVPICALATEGLVGSGQRNASKWEPKVMQLNESLAQARGATLSPVTLTDDPPVPVDVMQAWRSLRLSMTIAMSAAVFVAALAGPLFGRVSTPVAAGVLTVYELGSLALLHHFAKERDEQIRRLSSTQ